MRWTRLDEVRKTGAEQQPRHPPITPIISPSARNIRQMLDRVVPMAIIVPISRVRSKIDITIVFATLKITIREGPCR